MTFYNNVCWRSRGCRTCSAWSSPTATLPSEFQTLPQVTHASLLALAGLSHMLSLVLSGCTTDLKPLLQVTDASLLALAGLPHLLILNLFLLHSRP